MTERDVEALERREAALLDTLAFYLPRRREGLKGAKVALVGAGAVNLLVAVALMREGAEVTIFDAFADPRSGAAWSELGATFGGHAARIFSLTEARQHHVRESDARGASAYRRAVTEGGWLGVPPPSLDARDDSWIARHERLPGWLLRRYGEDVHAFNVESFGLWRALRTEHPELFGATCFKDGLVRTYPTPAAFARAAAIEARLGFPGTAQTPAELAENVPALAEAVKRGEIAGALSVAGFAVDVRRFGAGLVDLLERNGVAFSWQTPIRAILRDAEGRVSGLAADAGEIVADHYVLSPGAYGSDLLAGFACADDVASMIGGWVALPNSEPRLEIPLKISRRGTGAPGFAEGANVIPGRDAAGRAVLLISSGHGYLGIRPRTPPPDLLGGLLKAARETGERYFPAKYAEAAASGLEERTCTRPWTPSGLGILETAPTKAGGALVVVAAHNTGGFAQGPAVGNAVVATLTGRAHRMQRLYHPRRDSAFLAHAGEPA